MANFNQNFNSEAGFIFYIKMLCVFLMALFLASATYVLNFAEYFHDSEYVMWRYNKKIITTEDVATHADMVIIGDSRAKAGFNPTLIDELTSINLSLGGSSPVIGYHTFKNYLEAHSAPKNLLISYSPFILYSNSLYWERAIKYHYLSYPEHLDVASESIKLNDSIARYLESGNAYAGYLSSWIPFSFMPELRAGKIWQRKQSNKHIARQLIENKGYTMWGAADSSIDLNQETSFNTEITVSPLNMHYLDKLISLAAQNNVTVFWYTAPFNQASCDNIDDVILRSFLKFVDELNKKGVIILQKQACLPNEYFGDPSHLNSRGSAVVTQEIASKVLMHTNQMQVISP